MGAIATVRRVEKSAFVVTRIGVNRRSVAAAPVAERLRTDIQGHLNAVAGVVLGAAHLGQIPAAAKELGAQSRVSREAAAAQNQSFAVDLAESFGALHDHAVNPTALIGQDASGRGFKLTGILLPSIM